MTIDNQLKTLGEELKTLRLERGFSQREAATLSGLTQQQIGQIERAKTDYTMKSYLKYKAIFKNNFKH